MIQMYHPELLDDAGDMYSILAGRIREVWAVL